MKPDWKDAPSWANWLACDIDGAWFWYEDKPEANIRAGEWDSSEGDSDCATCHVVNWESSLEERPND